MAYQKHYAGRERESKRLNGEGEGSRRDRKAGREEVGRGGGITERQKGKEGGSGERGNEKRKGGGDKREKIAVTACKKQLQQ